MRNHSCWKPEVVFCRKGLVLCQEKQIRSGSCRSNREEIARRSCQTKALSRQCTGLASIVSVLATISWAVVEYCDDGLVLCATGCCVLLFMLLLCALRSRGNEEVDHFLFVAMHRHR